MLELHNAYIGMIVKVQRARSDDYDIGHIKGLAKNSHGEIIYKIQFADEYALTHHGTIGEIHNIHPSITFCLK